MFRAGKYGWTETFYNSRSDPAAAEELTTDLARARADFLGGGAILETAKIQNLDVIRFSRILDLQYEPPVLVKQALPVVMDSPWQAVLVHLYADATNRRNFLARCPADKYVDFFAISGRWATKGLYETQAEQFFDFLADTTSGWCIQGWLRTGAANTPKAVQSVTLPPTGGQPILTLEAGLSVGQTVLLKKFKGKNLTRLNGLWKLQAGPVPGTFSIPITYTADQKISYQFGGVAIPRNKGLLDISFYRIQRPVRRATGRQHNAEKGRSGKRPPSVQAV